MKQHLLQKAISDLEGVPQKENTMRADSASANVSLSTELPNFSSGAFYKWFHYVAGKFKDPKVNNVGGSQSLRVSESARLLQALGYGNFTTISKLYRDDELKPTTLMLDGSPISGVNFPTTPTGVRVSPFRLLAYHKVANDFYRYQKWEEYCAPACNVDYLPQNVPNMDNFLGDTTFDSWTSEDNSLNSYLFDMEYSRLPLDRFNGGLPRAQFGDESVVNLSSSSSQAVDVLGTDYLSLTSVASVQTFGQTPVIANNRGGTSITDGVISQTQPVNVVADIQLGSHDNTVTSSAQQLYTRKVSGAIS